MSEGGHASRPPGSNRPSGAAPSAQTNPLRSLKPGELGAARMNPVREERAAASAQINRSLKAWRSASGGGAGAAKIPQAGGAPLSGEVRGRMERQLGANLGSVKVHTGGDSAAAASKLGARAFTVGEDVHFNASQFAPGSKEGDRLLAHELTHVVQGQKSGVQRKPDEGGDEKSEGGPEVSEPGEPAEQEADAVGDQVADKLHDGDGEEKDGDEKSDEKKVDQKAPEAGTKLFLARPAPAPGAGGAAPGAAPGARRSLQTESQSDPVAKQKYLDVQNESAPAAAAKKAGFFKAAEDALNAGPTVKPLDAMRGVVRGGGYFFLGPEIPESNVIAGNGVSRVLDLPGLYKYDYVKPSVKSKFADESAFVAGAASGKFDPNGDIDERKSMRGSGGINETWWFPSNEANAVDLDTLRQALYIQDNPNYAKGAVRFDMDPAQLKDLDIKLYKPTAFDGMMQGWGNDPWWVTKPGPWGITKNNTHEAVMQSQQFRFFKKRTLLMPTAPAAGAGAGRPGGRP